MQKNKPSKSKVNPADSELKTEEPIKEEEIKIEGVAKYLSKRLKQIEPLLFDYPRSPIEVLSDILSHLVSPEIFKTFLEIIIPFNEFVMLCENLS